MQFYLKRYHYDTFFLYKNLHYQMRHTYNTKQYIAFRK